MPIKAIHFNRDIHTADEDKIIYGMNDGLSTERDNALMYGFVADAMKEGLLKNLETENQDQLGDIIKSLNQKSHKDGITRNYYGIVCHSNTDKEILWKQADEIILEALNSDYFRGQNVASLLIGSGLMGQVGGANITKIWRSMDNSKANVTLYTLLGNDNVPAVQLGMEIINRKSQIYNNFGEVPTNGDTGGTIPLIVPEHESVE